MNTCPCVMNSSPPRKWPKPTGARSHPGRLRSNSWSGRDGRSPTWSPRVCRSGLRSWSLAGRGTMAGGGLWPGPARAAVEAINRSGATVIAVDLPSGIDGANGKVRGVAVNAKETVTFCRRKIGMALIPRRSHSGRVHVVDIGISGATLTEFGVKAYANEPDLWRAAH